MGLVHERDALRQRIADQQHFSDEAISLKHHLEEMALQLQAAQRERDLLKQQQSTADEASNMRARLEEMALQLQAVQGERDLLQQQQQQQQAAADLTHSRALEAAFTAQMEEAQRNLSAKTMEVEALRKQLAEGTAAAQPQVAAVVAPSPQVMSSASEQQVKEHNRQLQLRINAVEEEKTTMVEHMRDHIRQLARENYDLKQLQLQHLAAGNPLPEQQQAKALAVSEGAAQKPGPDGSGTWLSYVLAPFLTESDLREIHADSYVDETLRTSPKLTSTV